jgi:hypothetical protein
MPVAVKGGIELRKALRKFTPDLAKETQKEMANLLKPITAKARGFMPTKAPLSGWGKVPIKGNFPYYNAKAARGGIGYKTTPSKANRQGFRSLARIQNASASGAIYETAGRKNPGGNFSPRLPGGLVGSGKMAGRALFKAWAQDGGKTNAAVIKAIEVSRDKFNEAVGYH